MKQKINISLDEEAIKKIKKMAKENHSNFSAMVNHLLWDKISGGSREYISEMMGEFAKKVKPILEEYKKGMKKLDEKEIRQNKEFNTT